MLASDLGTDKIHVFPLDASLGYPKTEDMFDISLAAGSGPRHLALSPEGKGIYVMTELSGEVVALSYDEEKLDTMQCVLADTCSCGRRCGYSRIAGPAFCLCILSVAEWRNRYFRGIRRW